MYRILHNVDNEKVTTLNSDKEFIEFVELIVKENGDEGTFSIIGVSDAKEYIEDYCPNLTLVDEEDEIIFKNLFGNYKLNTYICPTLKIKDMNKPVIVIVPVNIGNGNCREVCEDIEGKTYINATALRKELETLLEIGKIEGDEPEPTFYNIEDFTQGVNDQELDILSNSFIAYVFVEK